MSIGFNILECIRGTLDSKIFNSAITGVCHFVSPHRDPGQLLSTSNTLLLKVVTLQVGDDGSGSDESTSINSEGEVGPKYALV